jgi:hypothetical protein
METHQHQQNTQQQKSASGNTGKTGVQRQAASISQRQLQEVANNKAETTGAKSLQQKPGNHLPIQKKSGVIQRVRGLPLEAPVKFFDKYSGRVLTGYVDEITDNGYTIAVALPKAVDAPVDMPHLEDVFENVDEGCVFPADTVTEAIQQRFSVKMMHGGKVSGDDYEGGIMNGPLVIDEEHFGPAPQEGPRHMSGNMDFTRPVPNDMIFVDGGRAFMRMETDEGGELDKLIKKHRAKADESLNMFGKQPALADKLKRHLDNVHAIKTNPQKRDEQILDKGSEDLATMINLGFTMCWEKATFMHLLLTDLGIETEILQGPMLTNDKKHHAWVGIVGTDFVVEATAGFIATRANYLKTFKVTGSKVVARPKVSASAQSVLEAIKASGKLDAGFVPKSN